MTQPTSGSEPADGPLERVLGELTEAHRRLGNLLHDPKPGSLTYLTLLREVCAHIGRALGPARRRAEEELDAVYTNESLLAPPYRLGRLRELEEASPHEHPLDFLGACLSRSEGLSDPLKRLYTLEAAWWGWRSADQLAAQRAAREQLARDLDRDGARP